MIAVFMLLTNYFTNFADLTWLLLLSIFAVGITPTPYKPASLATLLPIVALWSASSYPASELYNLTLRLVSYPQ